MRLKIVRTLSVALENQAILGLSCFAVFSGNDAMRSATTIVSWMEISAKIPCSFINLCGHCIAFLSSTASAISLIFKPRFSGVGPGVYVLALDGV
jgi:hypothetical protein